MLFWADCWFTCFCGFIVLLLFALVVLVWVGCLFVVDFLVCSCVLCCFGEVIVGLNYCDFCWVGCRSFVWHLLEGWCNIVLFGGYAAIVGFCLYCIVVWWLYMCTCLWLLLVVGLIWLTLWFGICGFGLLDCLLKFCCLCFICF